ncbi:MAG: YqgE/AlgH family protein [Pirellulaceae bacterium]
MNAPSSLDSSLQGQFLVATPFVQEAPYRHTVVLLMRHTDRGSVGLVLNNNLGAEIAAIGHSSAIPRLPMNRDESSEAGDEDTFEEESVFDFATESAGEPDVADEDDATPEQADATDVDSNAFRLVKGCVIWPPGQLEREMNSGIWLVTPAQVQAKYLSDDLWAALLGQIGRAVLQESLGIRDFPSNPNLN